jgi:transcriptional regulator with XRE-family HTH domain
VTFAERFAANLKAARKQAGLSQEEASFRAGLHRTEVGMIERGERVPRIDTLVKVAGALGVKPGELLEGLKWKPAESSPGSFDDGAEQS